MILFWVRHGQTVANAEQRYQGTTDLPLSPWGREQAKALARRFAEVPLRAIYSSPLLRARETAESIAAPHGLEVQVETALREMDFGLWEGQSLAEVLQRDRERWEQWRQRPEEVPPPGGETLNDVLLRLQPFLERLKGEWGEEDLVLVVSHTVPIKVALLSLLDLPLKRQWQFRVDVASVSTLRWDAHGAVLLGFNETSSWPGRL